MAKSTAASPAKKFVRFSLLQRLQHITFLISFSILGFTGLPQKFPLSPISAAIFSLFGGIEVIRQIHHVSAIVMIIISLIHVLELLYMLVVLRSPISMIPWITDIQHVYDDVMYYLGFRKHKAYYGRYSYAEKAEYLALIWGTVVMALTGFMMWNPLLTVNFLPGEAIPAAKAAHGGEAVLAVLAIIVWHFYHVHIKTLNKSMFIGTLTREEMEHEHPAELAALESGKQPEPIPTAVLRKRQMLYAPMALVILVAFGFGFYYFVGYETTALASAPQGETAQVFVQVTPTPVAAAVETVSGPALNWNDYVGPLFEKKCITCHHGVVPSGGLDLTTYADALKGGKKGPAVVPNSTASSVLIQAQAASIHPGQLTADELVNITAWIDAGAPETAAAASQGVAAPPALDWKNLIGPMFQQKCAGCHGASGQAGLNVSTYADALKGGKTGAGIVPKASADSEIIKIQAAGGHPGQFSAEDLAKVKEWIDAGAPEIAPAGAAPAAAAPAARDWKTVIGPMFQQKCAGCHGASGQAGLNLSTYADALKGGKDGPGIVPKASADSEIIKIQAAGGHPGQFSAEDLAKVKEWIDAGAPEIAPAEAAPAAAAPAAPDWAGLAGPLFKQKCLACHGEGGQAGLNLSTYADALKGGKDGAGIVPKASAESEIVKIQAAGGHPGQLSAEELAQIKAWIDAGAVETATTSAAPAAAPLTWETFTGALFQQKCAACHGAAAVGGLNLSTYADALKGGATGPVITPKDAANSLLVTKQAAGGHPGQLTPEELAQVKQWIDAGALEK
jgi:mono/diheme cytochrome c family protein/cytochrome b subunit of formate dehydrogenase